ncbi:unnamed protein product [Cyprideis torosa]|uniref:MalT-like TPR region domain-containing protein n=1 Tax=Cyprideis torosa TaxID=163714 RepID=A0A7R8ZUW8_9CRUS|nr:unnamed protein product [Cyprideis torosa]CAG0901157.1 unnamed protein product [Cyprideis torosa]
MNFSQLLDWWLDRAEWVVQNPKARTSLMIPALCVCPSHEEDKRNGGNYFRIYLVWSFWALLTGQSEEEEDETTLNVKRGILAMRRGRFEEAEEMFHLALKQSHDENREMAVTHILDLMADLNVANGRLEVAEELYVDVMRRLLQIHERTVADIAMIGISLKLSEIFIARGDLGKAEEGYKYAVDQMRERLKDCEKDVGDSATREDLGNLMIASLTQYGRFLFETRRSRQAETLLSEAYELSVKTEGEESLQSIYILNDLCTARVTLGEASEKELEDVILKALKTSELLGEEDGDSSNRGSMFVNLGLVYVRQARWEEALEACRKGLHLGKTARRSGTIYEAERCLEQVSAKSTQPLLL